jgi:hypothetical protein
MMATIRREVELAIDADRAWAEVGDFGTAGKLFAGVLTGCTRAGIVRTVTFANGLAVSERLVTIDERERRLVYTVLDGPFSQHSASMQIAQRGDGCTFIWISDFLPDEATALALPLIEEGCRAIKRNLEEEGLTSETPPPV